MTNTIAVVNKTGGNRYLAVVDNVKKVWAIYPLTIDFPVGVSKAQLEDGALLFFDSMDDVETFAAEAESRGYHKHEMIVTPPHDSNH